MTNPSLSAVLWDYDGTLADTRRRNYNVVRKILADVTSRPLDDFPALRSPEIYDRVNRGYANWRQLYREEFGFTEDETDSVGRLWTEYQLSDDTPAPVFAGIETVLGALSATPHGIVSMNGRLQIHRSVQEAGLAHHFRWIVGWEDVDIRRQKPEPDGLLSCLERLAERGDGLVMYVGDHETDVRCAANANRELERQGRRARIITVAACFTGSDDARGWSSRPDYIADHPSAIIEIAEELRFT